MNRNPRITRITATPVVVPSRPDSIMSPELEDDWSTNPGIGKTTRLSTALLAEVPKYILRAETDAGITAIGETYRDVKVEHLSRNARSLIGSRILDLPWGHLPFAADREYDGFELLIYDLAGKTLGVPVHQLLGGRCRDRVECSMWTGRRTPDDAGRKAREGAKRGFDAIKFKCNQHDDVADWAEQVRQQAGPEVRMIFDPNQRWPDYAFAQDQMRRLKDGGYNVLGIEDPIARDRLAEYRQLREIGLNVVLHVALPYGIHGQRADDAVRGLIAGAMDAFNFNGSMTKFVRLATLAHLAGKPCWHGSEVDLGILEAGYVHAASASPACTWPSDIFGLLVREHDLLLTPLSWEGKYVAVPTGPGLGIELNLAAVDHYRAGADVELATSIGAMG